MTSSCGIAFGGCSAAAFTSRQMRLTVSSIDIPPGGGTGCVSHAAFRRGRIDRPVESQTDTVGIGVRQVLEARQHFANVVVVDDPKSK